MATRKTYRDHWDDLLFLSALSDLSVIFPLSETANYRLQTTN